MRMLYINKIQHFVVFSVFLHLLLFVTVVSFTKLNKEHQELEVFIISDVVKSHQAPAILPKKHPQKQLATKHEENLTIEEPKTIQTSINYPVSSTVSSERNSNKDGVSQSHINSKTEKGEIIDAEFGTASGPRFIHREIPVYPQIARRLGKEGKVVLRLTLNERGELINIEVIEGAPYGFTESAIEAVKKSKFSPAIKNGKPISCRAILPVRFVLKN